MIALLRTQKGFSLIEVIVAVSVLVILAFAFVPLFSTSFANIYTYGNKDQAMTFASDQLEILYASQPFSEVADITNLLQSEDGQEISSSDDLYIYDQNYSFNYRIVDSFTPIDGNNSVEGYSVTIVVFYHGGERHVEISSFIRGD